MAIQPGALLRRMFDAAVAAAMPDNLVADHLPPPPKGRTIVVGAGKAGGAMAQAVEHAWRAAGRTDQLTGLVITRYGHGAATERIKVIEAAHPVPDDTGRKAARAILDMISDLEPDDLVLCLMSGGGSALLSLPAPGLTLDDKRAVTGALLKSGATISEMNCVRKHLSAIKGGRLAAAAHPAKVVTLMISDVPNDDPAVIASGPTVPDPTTFAAARAVLAKYGITPPEAVAKHLREAADETPKPGDPRLAGAEAIMLATPQDALEAAAEVARAAGFATLILSDSIEGEARDVALVHAAIARQALKRGQPIAPPAVILSGGETTVTVRGRGQGGRNAEFLLALTVALDGLMGVHAIACDTDGIDGTEDNAGALSGPDSLARAEGLGLDAKAMLADNDGYNFFKALDDLIVTGPTRTNVNDFRAILVKRTG